MDRDNEIMTDHLPLEEVLLSDIDGIQAPDNWSRTEDDESPELPPVLIEEDRGYSLVGNHRTVWHLLSSGRSMAKCLVVRSTVHVLPAHNLIKNCTEEAMLFEGLLRREIVPNRSRLADMLGYSRARITQLLNLLKLPKYIRQRVLITDEISEFQLRQLLKVVDDRDTLREGFKTLLEKKLSGRQMATFASSDHSPDESDSPETSEKEITATSNKKPSEELDSMSELEEMFTPDSEGVSDQPLEETLTEKSIAENDPPAMIEPEEEPDMVEILRSIGNLRDKSWRAKAAAFMLPPLQLEFLEGVAHMRTGLYRKAMDVLEQVVVDDQSHHLGWYYLGRCANLTGMLQEAEEYLRNAVSRDPENPDYIVELAIVMEKLKRHSEAEAFYRKSAAIRKKPAAGR